MQGERLHQLSSASITRALTTYWLLLPQTPMLFMGQEFFASAPFLFFTDHEEDLAQKVRAGREAFLSQFPSAKIALEKEGFKPLHGMKAFARSKLDLREREHPAHLEALKLHQEVLRLRREDPVFSAGKGARLDGGVLSEKALFVRFFGEDGDDRVLVLNLGGELACSPCPQPLLAPDPGTRWRLLLSSEETRFGGLGAAHPNGDGPWMIPGSCALVLSPEEA